jgi:azurin
LHSTGYYTLNNIPSGEKAVLAENQKVMVHHHMPDPSPTPEKKPVVTAKPNVVKSLPKRVVKMPVAWKAPDQVVVLSTKPGLKYDLSELQVKAGSKIKLVFNNNDDMTHNVVVVAPGGAKEVGDQAFNLGLKGAEMNYIPINAKVLYHTNLIQPGTSESIYFVAPSKPGNYTYLCSYPGHAMIMQGTLKVVN